MGIPAKAKARDQEPQDYRDVCGGGSSPVAAKRLDERQRGQPPNLKRTLPGSGPIGLEQS